MTLDSILPWVLQCPSCFLLPATFSLSISCWNRNKSKRNFLGYLIVVTNHRHKSSSNRIAVTAASSISLLSTLITRDLTRCRGKDTKRHTILLSLQLLILVDTTLRTITLPLRSSIERPRMASTVHGRCALWPTQHKFERMSTTGPSTRRTSCPLSTICQPTPTITTFPPISARWLKIGHSTIPINNDSHHVLFRSASETIPA